MEDDVKQSGQERYALSQAYRWRAERDVTRQELEKVKCVAEVKIDGEQLEKLVHDAVVKLTGINRDALLALADECGDASRAYAGDGHGLTSRQFANVARRIREALGVVE